MGENSTFEEAFQDLEQVVQHLERGTATLDEALTLYAQGTQLAAHCKQLLESAQLRVQQLQENGDGRWDEIPFPIE
ncbi:MAG: exodeoxyribonuclease VII small subunit [Ardenticatenaceae bacterium]|nr:exodeoxyribonuclease VII small subunit [Ardenticatenaceae bacterium]